MNRVHPLPSGTGFHKAVLLPHPDTPCPAVRNIEVRVTLSCDGTLKLVYRLQGDVENLSIPAPASPTRTDRLWEHTCFEAFLSVVGETAYREFNFAPSGAWAAYGFQAYRDGGEPLSMEDPKIEVRKFSECFELEALLNLKSILRCEPEIQIRFGLSAVIETKDGHRSYWALHHPPGKPDFHHPEAFACVVRLPVGRPNDPQLPDSPG